MTQEVNAIEKKLACLEGNSPKEQQKKIDLLNDLIWILRKQDPKRGMLLCDEMQRLSQDNHFSNEPYEKGLLNSLKNRAYLNFIFGNYEITLTQSVDLLQQLEGKKNYQDVQVIALGMIGSIYITLGDYGEAITLLNKAKQIADKVQYKWGQGFVISNLARAYANAGEFKLGVKMFKESLKLYEAEKDYSAIIVALNNLAWVHGKFGNFRGGLPYGLSGLKIVEESEFYLDDSYLLDTMGSIYVGLNDDTSALSYYQQALASSEKFGSKQTKIESLLNIGKVYLRVNLDQAYVYLQESLKSANEIKAKPVIYECHYYLAEYFEQKGDLEQAYLHFQRFHSVQKQVINEETQNRVKYLRVLHDTETAKKEAEIFQLKNVALEQEIHDRQKAEKELKKYQDHLEELVQLRTEELTKTNSQLQSEILERQKAEGKLIEYATQLEHQNRELKSFAHITSHDLQEPLRKIQLFSDRLQTGRNIVLSDTSKSYLDRIQAAAAHSRSLIEALSSYAQVLHDDLVFTAVNLSAVLQQVVAEITQTQPELYIQISPSSLPTVEANWQQMILLFFNLLENASKFHEDKEDAKIQIESSITSTLDDTKAFCRILIIDNGIGFDEKYAHRVFTIFERVHEEGKFDGTGVGLAMCRRIVEQHAGKISVRSKVGKGTVVELLLPLKQS